MLLYFTTMFYNQSHFLLLCTFEAFFSSTLVTSFLSLYISRWCSALGGWLHCQMNPIRIFLKQDRPYCASIQVSNWAVTNHYMKPMWEDVDHKMWCMTSSRITHWSTKFSKDFETLAVINELREVWKLNPIQHGHHS